MKRQKIGTSNIEASRIALGCMRMADKTVEEAKVIIQTALDGGINFFDHADMYGAGKSESIFTEALK
ncbi:MAG: aldo/keto reductase family oxidoreductase, partial [Erysipelothrix sp.]|nr:aldo/keto reductase family oxidoreductase [Erysipelothrix sp.]